MSEFWVKIILSVVAILLSLVTTILLAAKKTKVVMKDTIFEKVCEKIPSYIRLAETSFKDGLSKKSFVIGLCLSLIKDLTGLAEDQIAVQYGERIDHQIESVLATPIKKGVSFENDA